jgi:hypothetical protein
LKHQLRVLGTSFIFTALWFKTNLDSSDINHLLLSFTLFYSALSAYFWRKNLGQGLPYTLAIASYALLFFMMNIFDNKVVVGLFILEGFIALALGFVIKSVFQKINGLLIYILGCIAGLEILSDGMDSLLLKHYPIGSQNSKVINKLTYYLLGILFLFFITDVTTAVTMNLSENTQQETLCA